MTQEDKDLLLKYLCMALPYGICVNLPNHHLVSHKYVIYDINIKNGWTTGLLDCAGRIQIYGAKVEDVKPYLRSMSSMTEEEVNEYNHCWEDDRDDIMIIGKHFEEMYKSKKFTLYMHPVVPMYRHILWLLKNHFDFMGLIPKKLAIEVTEENNPYESNM